MGLKMCRYCWTEKPRATGFYYGGGHKCKECCKLHVAERADEKRPEIQAYDRKRGVLPHRRASVTARLKVVRSEAGTTARSIAVKANEVLNNAVRDGRISKPRACEECGAEVRLHGHHPDHSKPLEVEWVCPPCHGAIHRAANEAKRAASAAANQGDTPCPTPNARASELPCAP